MHIMASFRSCGSAMERASKEIPCLVCDLSEPLTNLFAFWAPWREYMHIHEKVSTAQQGTCLQQTDYYCNEIEECK